MAASPPFVEVGRDLTSLSASRSKGLRRTLSFGSATQGQASRPMASHPAPVPSAQPVDRPRKLLRSLSFGQSSSARPVAAAPAEPPQQPHRRNSLTRSISFGSKAPGATPVVPAQQPQRRGLTRSLSFGSKGSGAPAQAAAAQPAPQRGLTRTLSFGTKGSSSANREQTDTPAVGAKPIQRSLSFGSKPRTSSERAVDEDLEDSSQPYGPTNLDSQKNTIARLELEQYISKLNAPKGPKNPSRKVEPPLPPPPPSDQSAVYVLPKERPPHPPLASRRGVGHPMSSEAQPPACQTHDVADGGGATGLVDVGYSHGTAETQRAEAHKANGISARSNPVSAVLAQPTTRKPIQLVPADSLRRAGSDALRLNPGDGMGSGRNGSNLRLTRKSVSDLSLSPEEAKSAESARYAIVTNPPTSVRCTKASSNRESALCAGHADTYINTDDSAPCIRCLSCGQERLSSAGGTTSRSANGEAAAAESLGSADGSCTSRGRRESPPPAPPTPSGDFPKLPTERPVAPPTPPDKAQTLHLARANPRPSESSAASMIQPSGDRAGQLSSSISLATGACSHVPGAAFQVAEACAGGGRSCEGARGLRLSSTAADAVGSVSSGDGSISAQQQTQGRPSNRKGSGLMRRLSFGREKDKHSTDACPAVAGGGGAAVGCGGSGRCDQGGSCNMYRRTAVGQGASKQAVADDEMDDAELIAYLEHLERTHAQDVRAFQHSQSADHSPQGVA